MSFSKRLRLYLSGFFMGLIFLLFVFGNKLFSWSYLPNDRVLAEIKIKSLEFSAQSQNFLKEKKLTRKYITDTVLVKGKIDFKKSNAQADSCPVYFLQYNEVKIKFTKCKKAVIIDSIY